MPPVKYHTGQFPPKRLDWDILIPLIGPAHDAIARYDGVLAVVPNANVLLSPLATQEAVLSSKIEGTITTVEEVLKFEAEAGEKEGEAGPKAADIREVINYRRAILKAAERLDEIPLSGRLIKEAHTLLLGGVRGHDKMPGHYRTSQNWIGSRGSSVGSAIFVPIGTDELADGVAAWERYVHSKQLDLLVQLALIHVEFEALHPFMDGNGRLGRMLVPLFLYERKKLSSPTFYISAYFDAHRDEYCERLLAVSRDGDWTGWCAFFLEALQQQGSRNTEKARAIIELYAAKKKWVVEETKSPYAIHALDFLFKRPIFDTSRFVKQAGIPAPTARRIVTLLRDAGALRTMRESSGRRPAVYAFSELLKLVRSG